MSELVGFVKRAVVSGVRRRRTRIWAVVFLLTVAVLGIQTLDPAWRLMPDAWSPLPLGLTLAIFFAALTCEYIDSALGMGYGTTLTPLLLLVGFDPVQVVPCVLLSEALSGMAAMIMHQVDGNVDFVADRQARSTAILLSVLSALGAIGAVMFALQLPKLWLNTAISLIVLSVGVITVATYRKRFAYRPIHLILLGAAAAFNKGLSGGGYGPLVTSGQIVSGMSPKQAVAITSTAEAWTCIIGLGAYLYFQHGLDMSLAAPLTLGALLSVPISTMTVQHMHETTLRCVVGVFTCALGAIALCRVLF